MEQMMSRMYYQFKMMSQMTDQMMSRMDYQFKIMSQMMKKMMSRMDYQCKMMLDYQLEMMSGWMQALEELSKETKAPKYGLGDSKTESDSN